MLFVILFALWFRHLFSRDSASRRTLRRQEPRDLPDRTKVGSDRDMIADRELDHAEDDEGSR
jgi:hypothetical protein